MKKISDLFNLSKQEGKKLLVTYITAGDPTLGATSEFVEALVKNGADIIELGVPYSDPIGDGPVNLRAAERSLLSKTTLSSILDFVGQMRSGGQEIPIVLFTYFNPVLSFGLEKFAKRAHAVGVDAVLIVDLPPEEASEYCSLMNRYQVGTVFLSSPTTSDARLQKISQISTSFVYYVSRVGVTGAQEKLSDTIYEELTRIRKIIANPLAVGFGISTPAQAREISLHCEGVVVGSALVKIIESNLSDLKDAKFKLGSFTKTLSEALKA